MKAWFASLFIPGVLAGTTIVLWHGLGDTCCNPLSIGGFKDYLEKQLNDTKVSGRK